MKENAMFRKQSRGHVKVLAYYLLVTGVLLITHHSSLITAEAQSATATLSGVVEDQNGAVIPGANVTVVNSGTTLQRQSKTSDDGYFTIPLLPPGTYVVRVEAQGFTPLETRDVVLNVGDQKSLQIQLKAGSITEMVQVVSEAPLINESPAVGTTVNRQFVANIPLNGRSFQSLITLTPGVVLTSTNVNQQGQFSVNGQRSNANYFTVDGVSANFNSSSDILPGQSVSGSLPGLTAFGGTNSLASVDALQEFRIQSSTYAPEFGRQPGGQISIITRSGANEFHGSLFDYVRNDVFDANDWFANASRLKRPPLRQNDFGGTFGGPVLLPRFGDGGRQPWYSGEDHTFFFFSYEGLRLRQPLVGFVDVPSVDVRQNAPAQIQPYLNAFPKPTASPRANGFAQFAASFSNAITLNSTSLRIDHTVNEKLTLFGRYNDTPSESTRRTGALSTLTSTAADTKTATVGATVELTNGVSNEVRVNYSRLSAVSSLSLDDFGGAIVPPESILLPPGFSSDNSLYTLQITGATSTTLTVGTSVGQLQRQINFVNHLSILKKSHQLKFGIDYRRLSPVYAPRRYLQSVRFFGLGVTAPGVPAPVGSALSGRLGFGQIQAQQEVKPLFTNFSLYAQDTWRVSPRLTLTYGLRWEVNPAPQERNGNDPFTIVGFENLATAALGPRERLYKTTYANFAPRFGAAYKLTQENARETIIRGGVGIFYDLGYGSLASSYAFFPYTSTKSLPFGAAIPLDTSLVSPPPFSLNLPAFGDLYVSDPNLKLPRVYQWNLSVERSLGSNQTLTASYVAALGRDLLRNEVITFGAGANPNFPGTIGFHVTRNAAKSDYHALQLQFQRRLSRGLQALASYTWSKSTDTVSNDASQLQSEMFYDPSIDLGPSDFDVRHAFNGAITYDFPTLGNHPFMRAVFGGWSTDGIFTAHSATPVDIIATTAQLGSDFVTFRPDSVTGVPLYVDDPSAPGGRRINRDAFSIPSPLRQGNLGRNALRGFPIWQIDMALRRQFNLSERLRLQLRAEAFNIFNHPNFGNPSGTLDFFLGVSPNANFGKSSSMLGRSLGTGASGGLNPLYQLGGPRSLQFAAKFLF
ncbi:MAG TPA: TonB-dependent receptor [Pyrinomonadaceae bacterium]|nr:TonB-dependent receptor [Pyrinomonadaceae bacterium]